MSMQTNPTSAFAGGPGTTPGSSSKPVGVSIIAIFFTAEWLFFLCSLLFTIFHNFSPEMRMRILTGPAAVSMLISELNGLLTVVAAWLLFAMRRIGAGLLLASTLLIAGLALISWPAMLHHSWHIQNAAHWYPLLLGGSNLVLHIAATIYAFRLERRGLLR